MNQNDFAIETQGLAKQYGDFFAVQDLDLRVPRHSITGFLGPNGAGKSTTIKLLLGLSAPSAGSGRVFGLDIVEESDEIRHRIGYLAQSPNFYPHLTARETLQFVARFFYSDHRQIEASVAESLDLVGLQDKADRVVKNFSGGERQRLGIAQAQINRPELLILDEPAAALDPMGREQVLSIMERLRNQATIFYSTHILDDVQRISDRVVILNRGRKVADGPISQLLDGNQGTVYQLTVSGSANGALDRLTQQPWVADVSINQRNGSARWHVAVTDEKAAEAQLLRLVLADQGVNVLSFGRTQYELEDVFMQLVRE